MKNIVLTSALVMLLSCFSLMAQSPQGFNYQAIARDNNGLPIKASSFTIETGILSDTLINTYLWKETHSVVTDGSGVFSLILGKGNRSGGSATAFDLIDWSSGPRFIRTRILYQSIWRDMGAARLWSVPYALIADKSATLINDPVRLTVTGDNVMSDTALFEVKRKDGETIFAVYNHGVRVNVPFDTLTKAKKGGFAIGGFDRTKGRNQDYLIISHDSIRFYFDDAPAAKGPKGGFAIGGFDQAKGKSQDFLTVNNDSFRIYIDETVGKGKKGGFAIGGFDDTKGAVTPFVDLTPDNYFIGHEAGIALTTGLYNSVIGYQAGKSITSGSNNIFIGHQSGFSNDNGEYNLFIGFESGYMNLGNTTPPQTGGGYGSFNCYVGYNAGRDGVRSSHNTIVGYAAGKSNQSDNGTFIGSLAGISNTSGYSNTFIGEESGRMNSTGGGNVAVGRWSGRNSLGGGNTYLGSIAGASVKNGSGNVIIGSDALSTGMYGGTGDFSSNVIIGARAGLNTQTADSNIFIGYGAAENNETGKGNVIIGTRAGNYLAPDASNMLVIDNSNTAIPLISGDFIENSAKINGGLIVTGVLSNPSDLRLKKNVTEIGNALDLLSSIRPVHFEWTSEAQLVGAFDDGLQTGVIAQEMLISMPFLVKKDNKGYLSVDYQKLSIIQLAAIKEQQKEIEINRRQIINLEERLQQLEALLMGR